MNFLVRFSAQANFLIVFLELNKNYVVQLQTVIGIVSDLKNAYR